MSSDPAAPLYHPPIVLTPGRASYVHGHSWLSAPITASVLTVPIPPDRGRAKPVRTLCSNVVHPAWRSIPRYGRLGFTRGPAADSKFDSSSQRYLHAYWLREKQTEPAYQPDLRHTILGRPGGMSGLVVERQACSHLRVALMLPWDMRGCRGTAPWHLATTSTVRMMELVD